MPYWLLLVLWRLRGDLDAFLGLVAGCLGFAEGLVIGLRGARGD